MLCTPICIAVPDELLVALVMCGIERARVAAAAGLTASGTATVGGWLLIDFPQTEAQAALLEKQLSGYERPKEPKKGIPSVRHQSTLVFACKALLVELSLSV